MSVEETEGDSVKSESVCGEVGTPHQPIVSQVSSQVSQCLNHALKQQLLVRSNRLNKHIHKFVSCSCGNVH